MGLTQKLGTIPLAIQTDSSNNVGIGGAANASYKLAVTGASLFTSALTSTNSAGTFFSATNTVGGFAKLEVSANATSIATLSFTNSLNLTGGNVGIGITNPTDKLTISGRLNLQGLQQNSIWFNQNAGGSSTGYIMGRSINSDDTQNFFIYDVAAAAFRMAITSGGSVCINSTSSLNANAKLNINGELWMANMTAGAGNSTLKYNTSTGLVTFDSSARIFKKEITDLQYGLDSVLKMQPKKYKWKSNDYKDLGFIADEMYEVVPEIVALADNKVNNNGLKDGEPLSINYDRLVPVLVKAIQELNQKVTALENK